MDFEDAAVRLARDQSKIKGRAANKGLGEKATRQAAYQKRQQERVRQEREKKKRIAQFQHQYMRSGSRALRTKFLGPMVADSSRSNNSGGGSSNSKTTRQPLLLRPTSIWGDGDKIALPPSVLETLTATLNSDLDSNDSHSSGSSSSPWTFRIGILNPEYNFPASPLVRQLTPPETDDNEEVEEEEAMNEDSDDDDDDDNNMNAWDSYLDELDYQYLTYTHCTVVEFTQEEGCVGIPQPIAAAFLDATNNSHRMSEDKESPTISTTRTVDPASVSVAEAGSTEDEESTTMDTTADGGDGSSGVVTGDKTPGHLAWGAFDIPNIPLEITLVKLPKGRGATLVPTREAVRRNFYGLKDVKLVLEQSLIRTRATLSQGDVVNTWHRGVKFDLKVTKVVPTAFRAVICINTDIEVDIGEATEGEYTNDTQDPKTSSSAQASTKATQDEPKGFRLGSGGSESPAVVSSVSSAAAAAAAAATKPTNDIQLPPEPPLEQKEGICTAQIRYSGGQGKRRFDVNVARIKDLFGFASSLMSRNETTFRLVTRFPRREWSLEDGGIDSPTGQLTLSEAGIQQGQELFLCENL